MGRRDVPVWSFLTAFIAAAVAASIYFLDTAGYTAILSALTGLDHRYGRPPVLCLATLVVGCGVLALGNATAAWHVAKSAA